MGDEFQPSQSVLEVVLKKAETKAQLRRTVKLYMSTVLQHPLQKNQRPRQRLADLLFKRFLDLGDNRFVRSPAHPAHALDEPARVGEQGGAQGGGGGGLGVPC